MEEENGIQESMENILTSIYDIKDIINTINTYITTTETYSSNLSSFIYNMKLTEDLVNKTLDDIHYINPELGVDYPTDHHDDINSIREMELMIPYIQNILDDSDNESGNESDNESGNESDERIFINLAYRLDLPDDHIEEISSIFNDHIVNLDTQFVNKIPDVIISSDNQFSDPCTICLFEFNKNDNVKQMSCNHTFHTECITEFLTEHGVTCPLCRKDFREDFVYNPN